jgi:hypothetical protein
MSFFFVFLQIHYEFLQMSTCPLNTITKNLKWFYLRLREN